MGKSAPKIPPPPDPSAIAQAQLGQNLQTALLQQRLNLIDEVGPFGTVSFESIGPSLLGPAPVPVANTLPLADLGPEPQRFVFARGQRIPVGPNPARAPVRSAGPLGVTQPDILRALAANANAGRLRRVTRLNPQAQAVVDQQAVLARKLLGVGRERAAAAETALRTPFSFDGLPAPVSGLGNDFGSERRHVEEALFARARGRLDPMFDDERTRLMTELANRGVVESSAAFDRALGRFNRRRDDAFQAALQDAIADAGAEQARLFQQSLANAELANRARAAGFQERAFTRNLPLAELATLIGTTPGLPLPNVAPTPSVAVAPVDLLGPALAVQQAGATQARRDAQARSSMLGGIFGLGGTILSAVL